MIYVTTQMHNSISVAIGEYIMPFKKKDNAFQDLKSFHVLKFPPKSTLLPSKSSVLWIYFFNKLEW